MDASLAGIYSSSDFCITSHTFFCIAHQVKEVIQCNHVSTTYRYKLAWL